MSYAIKVLSRQFSSECVFDHFCDTWSMKYKPICHNKMQLRNVVKTNQEKMTNIYTSLEKLAAAELKNAPKQSKRRISHCLDWIPGKRNARRLHNTAVAYSKRSKIKFLENCHIKSASSQNAVFFVVAVPVMLRRFRRIFFTSTRKMLASVTFALFLCCALCHGMYWKIRT